MCSQVFAQNARPTGVYWDGTIIDSVPLPLHGCGYKHLNEQYMEWHGLTQDWVKIWGTDPLISMIQNAAADIRRRYPGCDRLQVEDLSAENGGDVDGHKSHENGLDVDLGFYREDCIEHDPVATNEPYAPSMVVNGQTSSNFDLERNWELMKALHRYGDVARIFIDQTLKNSLCEYAKARGEYNDNREVLRSLRHVTNHADHIHVRLNCPENATNCTNQGALTGGTGCP